MAKSLLDPTKDKDVREVRERYEYAKNEWADIRKQGALDMRFVNGQPFDEDELDEREDRPTIAPEEMSQYRNQVTNALRGNPRGIKFQPAGNGASKKSAEFYQGKTREIEYRCHAVEAYIGAAENVLQRSYGYFKIDKEFESPRSPNSQLVITGFPDPDVVLTDPDAKRRTSEDMKYAFELEIMPRAEFKRKWKRAKVTNFTDFAGRGGTYKDWVIGAKSIQVAKYWSVDTRPRKLNAVMLSMTEPDKQEVLAPKPMFVFEDEIEAIQKQARRGVRIRSQRFVRDVDYPEVMMKITNGLEILHEEEWDGKYIPIVSIYGPILYVPEGGKVKKTILSMTRFGRDPWKAYCYACSAELEVLGMVPHGSIMAVKGQLAGMEDEWEESLHHPKLVLQYLDALPGAPAESPRLGPPVRLQYTQGDYLQATELVKEGFRRAIQAAMGSNFLPTQAQRINDKSGKALDKIDEAATQGTYHFVDAYEDGIRHGGVIIEDLLDKVHDYTGETAWMDAKLEAKSVRINDTNDPEAYSTRGDHLVTVSTAPSSDSEFDAVDKFLEGLLQNLQIIVEICGKDVAAAIFAQAVRMRTMGAGGDAIADMIEPESFKTKDGKPPNPEVLRAQAQVKQLTGQLQEAGMVIHTKQVEGQTKYSIEKMKTEATSQDKDKDREVKLYVAELGAKVDRLFLLIEGIKMINERDGARLEHAHDSIERAKDRGHEIHAGDRAAAQGAAAVAQGAQVDTEAAHRDAALESESVKAQATIDAQAREHEAALAPPPDGAE